MASQCNDKCECCPDHDTMLEPVLLFLLEFVLGYSFILLILVSKSVTKQKIKPLLSQSCFVPWVHMIHIHIYMIISFSLLNFVAIL